MTELEVAVLAARAAGDILRSRAVDGPDEVHHKGRVDLVTEVDLACEGAIREVLAHHMPDVEVLAEEGGGSSGTTRWIVDPLDGTTNFVHGMPWYCVSIALQVDGELEVGVVLDPVRDRVYAARRGHGASVDGRPMRVSRTPTLSQALVATGFPYDRQQRAEHYLAYVQVMLGRAQGLRRAGSAALDLAMLASGHFDAYWEEGLQPWDVAAGVLLVREAGGVAMQLGGGELDLDAPCPVASNGLLQWELVAALASAQPSG